MSEDAQEILGLVRKKQHKGGVSCLFCVGPVKRILTEILDLVIETQDEVSAPWLLDTLKIIYKKRHGGEISRTFSSLRAHLEKHDTERWHRINLVKRGPIED